MLEQATAPAVPLPRGAAQALLGAAQALTLTLAELPVGVCAHELRPQQATSRGIASREPVLAMPDTVVAVAQHRDLGAALFLALVLRKGRARVNLGDTMRVVYGVADLGGRILRVGQNR